MFFKGGGKGWAYASFALNTPVTPLPMIGKRATLIAHLSQHLSNHAVPFLAVLALVAVLAVGHELHLVLEVDAAHVRLDPAQKVHHVAVVTVVAGVWTRLDLSLATAGQDAVLLATELQVVLSLEEKRFRL